MLYSEKVRIQAAFEFETLVIDAGTDYLTESFIRYHKKVRHPMKCIIRDLPLGDTKPPWRSSHPAK